MLDRQVVSVSLARGIDTKTDPKQIQADYLLIQNAIYQTLEQLNLRNGFSALSTTIYGGGSITAGNKLASLNQALLLHDGSNAYTRTTDLTEWVKAGPKPAYASTKQGIGSSSSINFVSLSMCIAPNGLELYAWLDRGGTHGVDDYTGTSYYAVFDPVNNVTLQTGTLTTTDTSIRCECVGTDFFIITSNGARIAIYKQSSTSFNFSAASPTVVDAAANTNIIDTCSNSTAVYILGAKVYKVVGSTLTITSSAASTYGNLTLQGINYDAAQNNVWVASYSNSTGLIKAAVLDQNLGVVAALATIASPGTSIKVNGLSLSASNNVGYIYAPTTIALEQKIYAATQSAGSFTTVNSTISATTLFQSKPYLDGNGNIFYIGMFISSNQTDTTPSGLASVPEQPSSFLLQFPIASIGSVSTIIPNVYAKSLWQTTGIPYSFIALSSDSLTHILYYSPASILLENGSLVFPNLQTTDINDSLLRPFETVVKTIFTSSTKLRGAPLASSLHTTGGYLSVYDFSQETEHGFYIIPEIYGSTAVSSVVAPTAGSYEIQIVLRWEDSQGQTYQSAPSSPFILAADGTHSYDINFIVPTLSNKQTYYIDLYSTATNGLELFLYGTILYNPSLGNPYSSIRFNNFVGTFPIYTTGNVAPNVEPPAVSYAAIFKNRLFVIPSETPNTLWYSKQVIPGTPAEFSDTFLMNMEDRGGPTTALTEVDDKLVIFKKSAIYYIVGDGPDNTGANNDFSYPQIVPSDSGCTEPDSVISFPNGALYKGSKGIYLLDRSMKVEYIGAPVEAYNQFTITSADIDYNQNLIRYTLSNGVSLIYDYYVQKWSVFTNISAVSTCIANGIYSYLGSNGAVQQETPGVYSDNGSVIQMGFTTSWISFAKIQGFERLRRMELLGQLYSGMTLSLGFAYDFNPAIFQTITITNAAAVNPWQYRVFPQRQKCESMQLQFLITPADTSGKALSLSGIAMEVGVKRGMNKMPASVSVGSSVSS